MTTATRIVISAEDRASSALRRVSASVGGLEGAIGRVGAVGSALGLLGGAAAGLSFVGLVAGLKGVVDQLDALDESAQSVGLTTEALSGLRAAAVFGGVGTEALDLALTKLSVKLTDAAAGGRESSATFAALGIQVRDASGAVRGTDQVLSDLADRFASYRDGAEKTALAVDLFGKAGAKLIPFLNQGRSGIAALVTEAQRMGVVIGGDAAGSAAKLNDQLDKLNLQWNAIKIGVANSVVPAINDAIDQFLAAEKAAGGFFGALGLLVRQSQGTLDDPRIKIAAIGEEMAKLEEQNRKTLLAGRGNEQWERDRKQANVEKIAALAKERNFLEEVRLQRGLLTDDEKRAAAVQAELDARKQAAPIIDSKAADDAARLKAAAEKSYLEQLAEEEQRRKRIAEFEANEYAFVAAENERAQKAIDDRIAAENALIDTLTGRAAAMKEAANVAALDEAFFSGKINSQEYETGLRTIYKGYGDVKEQIRDTDSVAHDLGLTFSSAFEDAIVGGKGLSDVLHGIEQDILRILVRKAVTEPIANAIGGALTGSSIFGALFGGGRAQGGSVSGGTLYQVNERGPELLDYQGRNYLLMGANGGSITPVSGASGAGMTVNITQHINVGAGASRTELRNAAAVAKESAKAEILDSMRRGGAFRR